MPVHASAALSQAERGEIRIGSDLLWDAVQAAQEYLNVGMRYITLDNCDSYFDRPAAVKLIVEADRNLRRTLEVIRGWPAEPEPEEPRAVCGECGEEMQAVRPGRWQCLGCEEREHAERRAEVFEQFRIESGALPASWRAPDLAALGSDELADLIAAARAEERAAVAEQVRGLTEALRLVLDCPECGGRGQRWVGRVEPWRKSDYRSCKCREEARRALEGER